MKLLDLNIGVMLDNKDEVIELIKQDKYDIVTIQESMRKLTGNVKPIFNSCNTLKNKTKYKNNVFGPLWYATKEIENQKVTVDFGGCVEQGNQLLTNLPIIQTDNVFYYKEYSLYEDATDFRTQDHPRAFTNTILDVNGKQIQIINVHGSWSKDKQGNSRTQIQTKSILLHARQDIPCILVGDFNLLPNTKEIKQISKKFSNLVEKYNIKSTRPEFDDGLDTGGMVCDYIFVNDKVKINSFKVLKSNISDHYPLILDFDI